LRKAPAGAFLLLAVIPGRCVSIELWCAIAHLRISGFPDA
jgi:hypothetical protein